MPFGDILSRDGELVGYIQRLFHRRRVIGPRRRRFHLIYAVGGKRIVAAVRDARRTAAEGHGIVEVDIRLAKIGERDRIAGDVLGGERLVGRHFDGLYGVNIGDIERHRIPAALGVVQIGVVYLIEPPLLAFEYVVTGYERTLPVLVRVGQVHAHFLPHAGHEHAHLPLIESARIHVAAGVNLVRLGRIHIDPATDVLVAVGGQGFVIRFVPARVHEQLHVFVRRRKRSKRSGLAVGRGDTAFLGGRHRPSGAAAAEKALRSLPALIKTLHLAGRHRLARNETVCIFGRLSGRRRDRHVIRARCVAYKRAVVGHVHFRAVRNAHRPDSDLGRIVRTYRLYRLCAHVDQRFVLGRNGQRRSARHRNRRRLCVRRAVGAAHPVQNGIPVGIERAEGAAVDGHIAALAVGHERQNVERAPSLGDDGGLYRHVGAVADFHRFADGKAGDFGRLRPRTGRQNGQRQQNGKGRHNAFSFHILLLFGYSSMRKLSRYR